MGRKLLAVVPLALPASAKLERFHADATDDALLTVVMWTCGSKSDLRTRQLALDRSKHQLLELQRIYALEGERSWFVGNDVHQDGSLTVFSPVEPLFVLLGAAWTQRSRFQSVYDLLSQGQNTWLLQLQTLTQERIELVFDVQDVGGEEGVDNLYIKANESKILKWLCSKVERVAHVLAKQEAEKTAKAAGSGAFDAQVHLPGQKVEEVKSETIPALKTEDIARHHREAIEVVVNYLPQEFVELLCKEFKVDKKVEVKPAAALSASGQMDSIKRFDRRQSTENGSKRSTPSSAGSAKKKSKLANVDRTGMKSLTSFFTKK
ncbi:hypothetical protein BBO99_00007488 [Phytophthora kernoviae]|uniref:Ribonuclease H2 subunit B wHTH domain-containing protein n=2 Tax=Phytophthora kernoviae TaxID=325452 RepID=A0A3R7KRC0_9STRA|nr:hypothetical protein G195_008098 [Phytophthora kernoviae 00238/432]KAG2519640.1 hypothetical protein JM16_007057 [Phytophthora kernoviae]KAG2520840.1 hypothetical protein JM18_006910 [Phytophthora kernoviae]RLN02983.1 hypothetical protein BBI17_007420 [Phytophthora kernoviae]RLN76520.1 hypothetical protein BBO99_00007488 [Phytophthora kernoviae]